jgi:heme/copper-type cytochrome/quinol oxidase subunit 1
MTVIPMFWLGYSGMPRRVLDYPVSLGGWHSIVSAGHFISVAGLISFFVMIFDSLRQGRAVIRNTFGVNRFNTRLNFYLYQAGRTEFVKQKISFLYRLFLTPILNKNLPQPRNLESFETTLYTYHFHTTSIS